MVGTDARISRTIHAAAAAAAFIGGGLAQLPGSDSAALAPLQVALITEIAAHHGHAITKAAALKLLAPMAATAAGRGIAATLVGWLPGFGNVINAATAGLLTEAIGWAAHEHFSHA